MAIKKAGKIHPLQNQHPPFIEMVTIYLLYEGMSRKIYEISSLFGYSGNANRLLPAWQAWRKASPIRAGRVSCPGRPFGARKILPSASVYGSFFIP